MFGAILAMTAATAAPAPPRIEVMVLGTYHFDNPGRDRINVKADDVTVPRRQRELAALADAIAAFKPTRVLVERQRPGPGYDVADYAAFTPVALRRDRDETVQLGYRIAARAGLKSVQGIDEQPGPGEPDYFPFDHVDGYVKEHGLQARLDAIAAPLQRQAMAGESRMATTSIPAMLIPYNDEATPLAGQQFYYSLLEFGDGDRQPGAELNAMWYLRNAKIFSKLVNIARPGDRVLVVYGAGHGFWLRHFAANTPGFAAVDVKPYLERAAAAVR